MMLSVLYLLVPSAFKLGSRNLFYSSSIIVRKRFALSAGLLVSQADRVSNCSIQNEAIVVDFFLYTVWWKIDYYITSIIVVKISPRVDWRLRAWRQFPWHSWSWLINIEQISENIKRLNHFARSTLTETGLSGEASYKHKTSKEKTFPVHLSFRCHTDMIEFVCFLLSRCVLDFAQGVYVSSSRHISPNQ